MSKTRINILSAYERGYRVSENGILIGVDGKEIKYAYSEKIRYPRFSVWVGKENSKDGYVKIPVHRFAAYCFFGESLFDFPLVRHLNGNVLDFSKENLALGDSRENQLDRAVESRKASARKACETFSNSGKKRASLQKVCIISICPSCKKYFDVTRLSKKRRAKNPCCSRTCAAKNRHAQTLGVATST